MCAATNNLDLLIHKFVSESISFKLVTICFPVIFIIGKLLYLLIIEELLSAYSIIFPSPNPLPIFFHNRFR